MLQLINKLFYNHLKCSSLVDNKNLLTKHLGIVVKVLFVSAKMRVCGRQEMTIDNSKSSS